MELHLVIGMVFCPRKRIVYFPQIVQKYEVEISVSAEVISRAIDILGTEP